MAFCALGLFRFSNVFAEEVKVSKGSNTKYKMVDDVEAILTFTFRDGQEIIDFPFYDQGDVLSRLNPTFVLEGLVDNTPLLYSVIDGNLKIQSQTGTNPTLSLFQVDVELMADGTHVRVFNYVDCRVTDYVVESDRDKKDGYFKGYAFKQPFYDTMFEVEKAKTTISKDLRNTQYWRFDFTAK